MFGRDREFNTGKKKHTYTCDDGDDAEEDGDGDNIVGDVACGVFPTVWSG